MRRLHGEGGGGGGARGPGAPPPTRGPGLSEAAPRSGTGAVARCFAERSGAGAERPPPGGGCAGRRGRAARGKRAANATWAPPERPERRGEGSPGARQVGRGATVPEPRRGWGWVPLRLRVHVWAPSVLRGGGQGKSCGTAACRPGARCCVWSSPSLRSFVLSPLRSGTAAPRERRGEVAAAPPCPSVGPPGGQSSPLLPAAAACLPALGRPPRRAAGCRQRLSAWGGPGVRGSPGRGRPRCPPPSRRGGRSAQGPRTSLPPPREVAGGNRERGPSLCLTPPRVRAGKPRRARSCGAAGRPA